MKNIACILLAAGNGTRFGGDKLLASFDGRPMIEHACRLHGALPYAVRVAVTRTADEALRGHIDAELFAKAENPEPENGISGSVRIGLSAAIAAANEKGIHLDGALFSVCDQPRLRSETVQRLIEAFSAHPDRIALPVTRDGQRGNPAIFPSALFSELLSITGDRGGGTVIRRHADLLLPCETPAEELLDIDTPAEITLAKHASD